jgi:hypothetical protein
MAVLPFAAGVGLRQPEDTPMSLLRTLIDPARLGAGVAMFGALLVAGCVSSTVQDSPAQPPAPTLQLLDTGPLEIPRGCEPARGAVYRTSFVVQPDGSVTGAASESGDGCVQSALQQWASTFVYRPAGEPTATVVDWMCVTASRGR